MGQLASLNDFMLIARATESAEKFHSRVKQVLEIAASLHPDIAWRAQFEIGPAEHVEVFSAPDSGVARQVSSLMGALQGVKAEVAPLRRGW
ncbi:MAG TPA: hypothetical protein VFZ84_08710 [Burkholderiales bacterium]